MYQKSVTSTPRSTPATSSAVAASTTGPSTSAADAAVGSLPSSVRWRATAPNDAEPTPWPVDVVPASAAVRRSWVSADRRAAVDEHERGAVGVPSASYADPGGRRVVDEVRSAGSNWASPTRTNERRSATALALKP